MPELPEVETIANGLRLGGDQHPGIVGMKIQQAYLLWPRTLAEPTPEEFQQRLPGQKILTIGRRGKFLVFRLSQDYLLIHLRMSGDLIVEPTSAAVHLHHRLMLDLGDGWRLSFNDTRKFGRLWLVADTSPVLGKLGPEPLDADFTDQAFHQGLLQTKRAIKPLLLDQSFIAGLGNIYTDEALYLSRLHPLTPANTLIAAQASQLLASIRQVLQAGIQHHGSSIDWVYRGGDFQNFFLVYQRTGQPCRGCGSPIERMVLGQRGTHFCPVCQKRHVS
jgi:formamidopyrimidine-DNA glycosylase